MSVSLTLRGSLLTDPRRVCSLAPRAGAKVPSPKMSGDFTDTRLARLMVYPAISMPMLRAVPATMRKAASSFVAFKSFIFNFTMSNTCLRVTFPTLSLFGVLEPEAMPAAFFSKIDAGGDLVMNVKDLSWYTVMTTGITLLAQRRADWRGRVGLTRGYLQFDLSNNFLCHGSLWVES